MMKSMLTGTLRLWMRHSPAMLLCFSAVGVVVLGITALTSGKAMSQNALLDELAPPGWTRDESLNHLIVDHYTTESGTLSIDLMAFPATNKSAKAWGEHFINSALKKDRNAGRSILMADTTDSEAGSAQGAKNTAEPDLDMSLYTVMVLRPRPEKSLFMKVRTIIRAGQPVQLSMLKYAGSNATEAEYQQARKIAYDARLSVDDSVVSLELDAMIDVMASRLVDSDTPVPTKITSNTQADIESAIQKSTQEKSSSQNTDASTVNSGYAPVLVDIPKPHVKVTGEMLGPLPAGYRMHIWATNYWVNRTMTSTRELHLHLTKDGQFEKGSFSISGSGFGEVAVVSSSDKTGSTGSVLGNTAPGTETGAKSVYLQTREGLDPEKYGTYYISGDEIELRYASGEIEKHAFQTDGYRTLILEDKEYWVNAPKGWELYKKSDARLYRDLDGAYMARVTRIKGAVPDGKARMQKFIAKGKQQNLIKSAGPISEVQAGRHKAVRSTMVMKGSYGVWETRDVYFRYGENSSISRMILVDRYKGAKDDGKLLSFIEDLP